MKLAMPRLDAAPVGLAMVAAVFGNWAFAGPVEDLSPGYWYEVPNSKLSSVDPCPSNNCSYTDVQGQKAVIDVWNGGAVATRYGTKGGYIVWGGGHTAYNGNEVYIFDVDTLQWKRLSDPVQVPVCNITEGELQDGSPCTAHTYDGVDYDPSSNSFVILGAAGLADTIYSSPRTHLFSLNSLSWRRGDVYSGKNQGMYGISAYDPNRGVFWMYPGYNAPLGMYDPNANSGAGKWTMYNPYNADIGAMSAIDPGRDLMVWVDGASHHQLVVFDLKDPNNPATVTFAGDTAPMNGTGMGFDWDATQEVFVAWLGGTDVYTLTPPSGDWKTGTWIWTKVSAAPGNTVIPTSRNSNGTYSRWRYVPAVNAWIVVNRTTDDVYFYKLSAGAAAVVPDSPANLKVQ